MAAALPALDADIAIPTRKPQFAVELDPRWALSFYHGCGAGPYGLAPYVSRGIVPKMSLAGSIAIAPTQDGWAVAAAASATSALYSVQSAGITWAPSQTNGTILLAFRATSSSTADTVTRVLFVYGDDTTSFVEFFFEHNVSSGNFAGGWYPNEVVVSATGLWNAGDIVVLAVPYAASGSTKQTLYVNGVSKGTGSGTPANLTGSSVNEISIGNGQGLSRSTEYPILYVACSDRMFSPSELAWIAKNPLNWMFAGAAVSNAFWAGLVNFVLTAAAGVFSLVGEAMALLAGRKLATAPGAIALTGEPTALTAARKITAAAGAFTLTGKSTTIMAARKLVVSAGAFDLTGDAATITAARKLSTLPGAFTLTGDAVSFNIGLVLTVLPGAYSLLGEPVAILASRLLPTTKGVYSLTGEPASMLASRKLTAATGTIALSGKAIGLLARRTITAAPGAFALTGAALTFSIAATMFSWKPSGRLSPYLHVIATAVQARADPASTEMQASIVAAQPVPSGVSE